MINATLRPFILGKFRYPLYRRLGGPKGRSGRVRKISPPTGIRSPDCPARSESLYRLRCRNALSTTKLEVTRHVTPNSTMKNQLLTTCSIYLFIYLFIYLSICMHTDGFLKCCSRFCPKGVIQKILFYGRDPNEAVPNYKPATLKQLARHGAAQPFVLYAGTAHQHLLQ